MQPALIDGAPAGVGLRHGQVLIALLFWFSADRIVEIEAVATPERLATLDVVIVGESRI